MVGSLISIQLHTGVGWQLAPSDSRRVAKEGTAEDYKQATLRREFGLKMVVGQLPTLARQRLWSRGRPSSGACCRCQAGERETWQHVAVCRGNRPDQQREARDHIREATRRTVVKLNERRMRFDHEATTLSVCQVATAVVGNRPISDTGLLIGRPMQTVLDDLSRKGLRYDEKQAVLQTASQHALDYARRKIWVPRCEAVEEALGPWRTRATQNRQPASPGEASLDRMRTRSGGRRPPPNWDAINKRAFDTEAYLKVVAPSWSD